MSASDGSALRYPNIPDNWSPIGGTALDELQSVAVFPELFMGIIRAQGADAEEHTLKYLEQRLLDHSFLPYRIEIADLIAACGVDLEGGTRGDWDGRYARIRALMDLGEVMREAVHPAVAAMMAVTDISVKRAEAQEQANKRHLKGIAYLIRHLVSPDEVSRLRSIYRQRFFALAFMEDADDRRKNVISRLREQYNEHEAEIKALELLQIDEGHASTGVGGLDLINVIKATERADVFVTVNRTQTIDRFLSQLFGFPYFAPKSCEMGMAYAFLAAKRSVALGRSVGSAIMDKNGDLIALGWNEIAAPHRGVSSEPSRERQDDNRDHVKGFDTSDRERINAVHSFFQAIAALELELPEPGEESPEALKLQAEMREALSAIGRSVESLSHKHFRFMYDYPTLRSTRILNLIEFGRSVHAEMAAIASAARRGVGIHGSNLFVTTFPCHECARNIVAAGIATVTYLQPYNKSMAKDLYSDLIDFRTVPLKPTEYEQASGRRVLFAPYEGFAPSRFDDLFSTMLRKESLRESARKISEREGNAINWDSHSAVLRDSIRGYRDTDSDWHFEVSRILAEESVIRDLDKRYSDYKTWVLQQNTAT